MVFPTRDDVRIHAVPRLDLSQPPRRPLPQHYAPMLARACACLCVCVCVRACACERLHVRVRVRACA